MQNMLHSVCRTTFYHIHVITGYRVRTVLDKQGATGVTGRDLCGKSLSSKSTISQDWKQSIIDHINGVPKVSSHYSRAKSPHRKYLPPG